MQKIALKYLDERIASLTLRHLELSGLKHESMDFSTSDFLGLMYNSMSATMWDIVCELEHVRALLNSESGIGYNDAIEVGKFIVATIESCITVEQAENCKVLIAQYPKVVSPKPYVYLLCDTFTKQLQNKIAGLEASAPMIMGMTTAHK